MTLFLSQLPDAVDLVPRHGYSKSGILENFLEAVVGLASGSEVISGLLGQAGVCEGDGAYLSLFCWHVQLLCLIFRVG